MSSDGENVLAVGIDPSSRKIAIVATCPLLNVAVAQAYVLYKGNDKQTPESLGRAMDAMDQFLIWADQVVPHGSRYAWVENPLVGRGGIVTTMKQAYVGGIIRGALAHAGFKVYGVNVSTWKKDVCGDGRAQKTDVLRCVRIAWPKVEQMIGDDGDLADAAAICLYGTTVLRKTSISRDAPAPRGRVRRTRP